MLQDIFYFVKSFPAVCTINSQHDPNSCNKRSRRSCALVADRENSVCILSVTNTRRLSFRK